MQARGHASHLISLTPHGAEALLAATTLAPTPDWPASCETAIRMIEAVVDEFRPDVAYVHAVYHPALVKWIAQRLPSVAYIHAPYPVCPGSAQYLRRSAKVCTHTAGPICLINAQLEKCCWGHHPIKHLRLLQRVRQFEEAHHQLRRMIVGSTFMRDLAIRGGAPADNIECLPPVLLDPQNLPERGTVESATVLYAGRLTSEKGIGHLIQALASVPGDWRLLIAGDGPERQSSAALAQQLGVADRIEFLGWLDQHDLSKYYRQCAVVAFPSLWPEPFGRVGPEAYIHGKPVVAYATGGVPDWLIDGETGYLVAPGNVTQLSQRLQQLLTAPTLSQHMGEQARRMAREHWTADQHIAQLLRIFGAAVAHKN